MSLHQDLTVKVLSSQRAQRNFKPAIVKSARKVQQNVLEDKVDLAEVEADLLGVIESIN
jgi:hypothetical protein